MKKKNELVEFVRVSGKFLTVVLTVWWGQYRESRRQARR